MSFVEWLEKVKRISISAYYKKSARAKQALKKEYLTTT